MAVEETLSKVKSDVFAILIPGFFITGVIVSAVLVFTQTDAKIGIIKRFGPFFKTLKGNWILTFIAFVIIFLAGNFLRSIKVTIADNVANFLFKRFIKASWTKLFYGNPFPYRDLLEKIKLILLQNKLIEDIPLPVDKHSLYILFQYWKMVICIEKSGSFSYIQEFESRVRMFAGMFWAGSCGIGGSILISASFIFNKAACIVWWKYILLMFLVSVIIAVIFSRSLKRVRSEEVISVFIAYLFIQRSKKEEDKKEKVKEKGNLFGPLMNMFKGKEKE